MKRNKSDRIGSVERELYSKTPSARRNRRSRLREGRYDVPDDWGHSHEPPKKRKKKRGGKRSFAIKFLIVAVVFFLIAVAISAIVITRGANVVSSKNVDVVVLGPASVSGGDALSLQVEITNRNSTTLKAAEVVVEFPDGTRSVDDSRKEVKRLQESVGDVPPGSRELVDFEALVFGQEGEEQEIVVGVEYRIAGSNAIFAKEKLFTFEISSSPITVLTSIPKEVNAGQEVEIVTEVVSNATSILEDVMLVVEYPFGFVFDRAVPGPSFGNNIWSIGDLPPGGKRAIKITGVVTGQDNEERTFRFSSGIIDEDNERAIGTPFLSSQKTLTIKRPFIAMNVALNGSTNEVYVTSRGETIRADIVWTNNLPVPVSDIEVDARIEGGALDESSVSVDGGFYRSIDNTASWDSKSDSDLESIKPGGTGRASFDFKTKDTSQGSLGRDPEITISVSLSGVREGDSETKGPVNSDSVRSVLIASDISLGARALHFAGPFKNTGPIPPEADKETSYTVTWTITNSSNDVSDVKVSASLPSYMKWTGLTDPSSEKVTYSPVGGEIVWDAGEVLSGTGYTSLPRDVSFKIVLLPSISQVQTTPEIVGRASLTGVDQFTDTEVSDSETPLTTRLTTDPGYKEGQGTITD